MTSELNILALIKGNESYVFVYDDVSRAMLVDSIRDYAADPSLSFSWFDAAVLTEKAKQQTEDLKPATRTTRPRKRSA